VRLLQQAVGGWEWTQPGGVPSRAWLQVIDVPGMPQEPYQWDARSRVLAAYFDVLIGPLDMWGAHRDGDQRPQRPACDLELGGRRQ
jgi:hypothetical protein